MQDELNTENQTEETQPAATEATPTVEESTQDSASGQPSILIVEDESPLANAVNLKLKSAGFEVFRAADGVEGLDIIDNNKIDLVLLDLLLPNLDGFEVLRRIREAGNNVHVVITSNLSQEEDRKKAMDLGANDYLVKSDIQLSDLVDYINQHLN